MHEYIKAIWKIKIRLRIGANKLEDCKFWNPWYDNIKDDKCK